MDFPKYAGEDWLRGSIESPNSLNINTLGHLGCFSSWRRGQPMVAMLKKVYNVERLLVMWKIFEKEVLAQFGPTEYENFDEVLSWIQQHSTLRECQREFEHLVNRVSGLPEKALIGTFLGGLKDEIAVEVCIFKPRTLLKAIELARMQDDQLSRSRINSRLKATKPQGGNPLAHPIAQSNASLPPIKKISWEEMQKRREKGLCFNCNDRFTSGYRCQVNHMFVIEAEAKGTESKTT